MPIATKKHPKVKLHKESVPPAFLYPTMTDQRFMLSVIEAISINNSGSPFDIICVSKNAARQEGGAGSRNDAKHYKQSPG